MRETITPKKEPNGDWKWSYIKYELTEAGETLTSLSKKHGYEDRCALRKVKDRPWKPAEKIIATVLRTTPQIIWPSRYPEQVKCTPKRRKDAA